MTGRTTFDTYRAWMLAQMAERARHADEVKRIRAEVAAEVDTDRRRHPKAHTIAGQTQEVEYEVEQALKDRPDYRRARDNREAARHQADHYGIAAMVEGLALLLDGAEHGRINHPGE